ncbi:acyl-homoserine-lactone synthase [Jiella marina]|uniref:acyl-homoserine-lactone synthase n=1 Tax=Jiella sp. LLJ827 TaxID=2917712 RepID=UPI002101615E|nr:acyl-homoserine-lactone synthase [Jiella sp. LLJ827]MCQ0987736.1 GNAT family N-acetyltransferase [Jiella sp. LLJ827]
MISVHVVSAANRHLYEDELDQHHRLRCDIYIGEHGWRALVDRNGREADQFDYPEAVYLLAVDPKAGVVGGTRLLPSWKPTLLSAVFPEAAAVRGMPQGPDVWEWTRFFVAKSHREEHRLSRTGGAVLCSMFEYLLEEGVREMRALGEAWWIPRIQGLGWRPRPLGLPIAHEGMTLAGFAFDITQRALEEMRGVYGIEHSCLVRRGLAEPLSIREDIHAA